jgi:putative (di)nucleoside polyphosphate hydrolase
LGRYLVDPRYRPCVLAVFTNERGEVLVAERAEPRGAWQFPQGGIDAGETPEDAVRREMHEELGSRDLLVVGRAPEAVTYDFPPDARGPLVGKFRGQAQVWFHLRFAPGGGPDLARASDREFVAVEWVSVGEALRRCVAFKRQAYVRGLTLLELLPFAAGVH